MGGAVGASIVAGAAGVNPAAGVKIATSTGIVAGAAGAGTVAGAAAAAARREFAGSKETGMAGGAGRPPRNENMSLVDKGAARILFITSTFTLRTIFLMAMVFWLLVHRRYQ